MGRCRMSGREGTAVGEIKDTYKYHVKLGGKTVDRGITYDLERRGSEEVVRRSAPVRLVQVGRRTTRTQAQAWLRAGGKRRYRIAHPVIEGTDERKRPFLLRLFTR